MSRTSHLRRPVALLLLACVYAPVCTAENSSYYFQLLTQSEGLSESTVTAVVQDRQGFIWLGTQDGLDRYDGYGFRVFRRIPDDARSLSESNITALHLDQAGTLWVGTKNGLSRYDPGSESFTRFINGDRNPVGVYAIADAGPGALWLNTDRGLLHLDTHTAQTRVLTDWRPGAHVDLLFPLLKDNAGTLWVAPDHGLGTIDAAGTHLIPFPDTRLAAAVVTAVHQSQAGAIWIGTAAGDVYTLSADHKKLEAQPAARRLAQSPITRISDTSDGTIWVATENRGLLARDPDSQQWWRLSAKPSYRNGLPSDLIVSLYVDHSDRLWIALRNQGVAVLNSFATKLHSIGAIRPTEAPLSDPVVHAILLDSRQRLWVGTANGLDVFSDDFRQVRYYGLRDGGMHSLKGHIVYALFRDHLDQIWVGLLNAGLCLFRPKSDDFKCYAHRAGDPQSLSDNSVLAITEDSQGFLWLGTLAGGLDRFDPRTGIFLSYQYNPKNPHSLSSNTIYSLAADTDGTLWVGTSGGGLNRFDPAKAAFTRVGGDDLRNRHFLSSVVVDLLRTSGDLLWIGTSEGLYQLNTATGELRAWTVDDGLPSNFVGVIAADAHGLLWLGTNSGLVRFDPTIGVLETLQSTDGLPADEFNHNTFAKSADGTIFMGTMNGVVGFRPDDLRRSLPPLKVTLTDLLSYGKRVDIQPDIKDALLTRSITETPSLVLPYTRPAIALEFSALDAPNPAHVRYTYRFHGLDDTWTYMEAGHHIVNYKPTAAGHFVFEVRAVGNNGTSLGDLTHIDITVLPAPWFSPWAYSGYVIVLFALLAWLALRQRRRLTYERQQATFTQENEARLQLALWASGEGTWDARPQDALMYCAELMLSLGYKDMPQPVTRNAFMQLQHPDDRTLQYERYAQQCQSETGVIDIEFRIRNSPGDYVWWKMRGKVVERDAQGNATRAIGMAKDISADKEKQAQLQLAALFMENSTDSIVILDQDYRIIKVNRAFEHMTGFPETEVYGRFPAFLSAARERETRVSDIKELIRAEGKWSGEGWIRRRSGENFLGRTQVNAIYDEHGHISHFVGITADITRQRLYEDELRHLANHDTLTGLPNRTLLTDRLGQAIATNQARGGSLGVVLLSLDNFSRINDSLGHDAGDEVLRETARRLLKAVTPADTVSRVGGDTFALLLVSGETPEAIEQQVKGLLQALTKPVAFASHVLYPSASAGISLFPADGGDPATLIKNAEAALFKTKVRNKGTHTWYAPSMGNEANDYIAMQTALHRAIEQGELAVHYQPKLRTGNGRICGVEALVRWRDKDQHWILPSEFIPVAEMYGLIDRLGEWVLKTACHEIGLLEADTGIGGLTLAVNLSPKQVQVPDLSERVMDILRAEHFPAERLQFELTESVLMYNPAESVKLLEDLRAQGITLAVDDFGTGYSSLGYLKRFPIGEIKVDKTFVEDMDNRFTLAIIMAIVALGRSLGMEVTAEGVESQRQMEALGRLGCTQLQGYFIAKPMDYRHLCEFLSQQPRVADPVH